MAKDPGQESNPAALLPECRVFTQNLGKYGHISNDGLQEGQTQLNRMEKNPIFGKIQSIFDDLQY